MGDFLSGFSGAFANVPWTYIGLGIGTVFVGLICIIILCKLIGLFCRGGGGKTEQEQNPDAPASVPAGNRRELIAAVTAACAEYSGTDVKAIRVVSFKKI